MGDSTYSTSRSVFPPPLFSLSKFGLTWPPSIPVFIPHRIRRKLRSRIRSRQSPSSSITVLQTSFNPKNTLRSLRKHRWSYYDAQYILMVIIMVFSLSIMEQPGALIKTGVATLLITALIIPVTRQFWLPFLPIGTWLVFFFSARFIPVAWRPPIWVRVLPALENIFYGANLSNILSAHQNSFLDVMAVLPYGFIHFGAPFVVSGLLFLFGPPGTLPAFARSFGYMNLVGVIIQQMFPCSPPWYENMFGLAPANYSMSGSPAGLARIDALLGFDMFTTKFINSPVVFGAFPSLHAGCATTEALFMAHVFPKLQPLFITYVLWLWWATMYLSHHYAVDLVGGSLLAGTVYYICKSNFLPRMQSGKSLRWDYDFTEIGEAKFDYSVVEDQDKLSLAIDSELWTIGSTSSFSPGPETPSEDNTSLWDGETLGSTSDSEAQIHPSQPHYKSYSKM